MPLEGQRRDREIRAGLRLYTMFTIDDQVHCESSGHYANFEEALAELRRRADIPWDREPNRAPCVGWEKCGREYAIVEYDDARTPWTELNRVRVLEISEAGVKWSAGFGAAESTHPAGRWPGASRDLEIGTTPSRSTSVA